MIGVILCGGQSTRMGRDKGLMKLNDKTWVQTAIDKLNSFQLPVIISVNEKQYQEYSSIFSAETLVTDDDSLQIHGPLCGVLSVHRKYPNEDMLVLACDMPLMETELIKELLTKYITETSSDAFIYFNDGEPEPMPGIYKSKGLAFIHHLYVTTQLQKHSMKYMLQQIKTSPASLPVDKKKYFRNFNAQAELNGL